MKEILEKLIDEFDLTSARQDELREKEEFLRTPILINRYEYLNHYQKRLICGCRALIALAKTTWVAIASFTFCEEDNSRLLSDVENLLSFNIQVVSVIEGVNTLRDSSSVYISSTTNTG